MKILNLFALTNDPSRKVLRIPLSKSVQQEVSQTLLEQETEFNKIIQQELIFDGKYKPDHGEVLVIKDYDDIDELNEAIKNPLSIPEIVADISEFNRIIALFSGYERDGSCVILIQNFDRRRIISQAGISIFHAANVYKKVDGVGLSLDTTLAATLVDKNLKFLSFHVARKIFDLSKYYLQATDADLAEFAAVPALHIHDHDKFVLIADSWVRRKVALIKQSKILEVVPLSDIKSEAEKFGIFITITTLNGKDAILIPEEKSHLKNLLRFLDEDYYTSTLSSTKFITNSKRPA